MKIIIKAISLVIFICVSIQAGGGRCYKAADLRQKNRVALKAAQQLAKLAQVPTLRYQRRHPSQQSNMSVVLSNGKKSIGFILALMIMLPTVAATSYTHDYSMISSKVYRGRTSGYDGGDESRVYGTCQKLTGNSTLCCGIGKDYTVTCCVYPSKADYDRFTASLVSPSGRVGSIPMAHCISYDIEGIKGDQAMYLPLNLTAMYMDAEKQCKKTYKIASEATLLQKDYTAETFKKVGDLSFALPNGTKGTCPMGFEAENAVPTLIDIGQRLFAKFNLRWNPAIRIFNDLCDSAVREGAGKYAAVYDNIYLLFYGRTLVLSSDEEHASVMGHEIGHCKRYERYGDASIKNNEEAEADLASILATDSPCVGVFLNKGNILSFPSITRENLHELIRALQEDDPHPSTVNRIAFVLTMYEHHKRAIAYLLMDH